MQIFIRFIIVGWSISVVGGCDRKTQFTATPKQATTDEVATNDAVEPTTGPAISKRPVNAKEVATATTIAGEPSFMMIDQKRVTFPPARLRVNDKTGRLITTLFSDDPKEAIDDSYKGNSFYMEMPLDVQRIADLNGASWGQSSSLGDREDSPYGVFLDGRKTQLQPLEIKVDFDVISSDVTVVWMSGRFLATAIEDDGNKIPPREISLAAKLTARMSVK